MPAEDRAALKDMWLAYAFAFAVLVAGIAINETLGIEGTALVISYVVLVGSLLLLAPRAGAAALVDVGRRRRRGSPARRAAPWSAP
jgi:hypothetical protein